MSRPTDESLLQDETTISEITIGPDGRVFTFGTSRAVVELLHRLCPDDTKVKQLLAQLRAIEASSRRGGA